MSITQKDGGWYFSDIGPVRTRQKAVYIGAGINAIREINVVEDTLYDISPTIIISINVCPICKILGK